jgi:hypothetical protein
MSQDNFMEHAKRQKKIKHKKPFKKAKLKIFTFSIIVDIAVR